MWAKSSFIFLLALCLLPASAFAQFGFHAGSHFGYGRITSETSSLPTRDMGTFDLQFMPGYRLPPNLMGGILLDYRFMSQLTDEQEVGGSNFSGRGFLWGLGAAFEPGPLKFLFSYDLQARHYYSGPDTTYKGSGFHILFGYEFMAGFHVDLEYVSSTYNTLEVNDAETPLGDNTLRHWNLGLGVSYSY
jgi:hypothetical protein